MRVQLQRPFRAVTPTVDGDVLSVLARADVAFTVAQVHELIGDHSLSGVRNSLRRLVEHGLVTSEKIGLAKTGVITYSLNRRHIVANAVAEIASARTRLLDAIREQVASWKIPAIYAAMFGSAARGEMRPDSDIDLFVVRPARVRGDDAVWAAQLYRLTDDVSAWTGNDARVLEYGTADLKRGLTAGERVLKDIRKDGIALYGQIGATQWAELGRATRRSA